MLCSSASCSTCERFKNARQVGNYFGLCPSESSSGERRRLGSITKHGNPRLRRLMVETGLADRALAAALRGLAALGTSAVGRQQWRRCTQKSDRKRSAAPGDRFMADRYWAQRSPKSSGCGSA